MEPDANVVPFTLPPVSTEAAGWGIDSLSDLACSTRAISWMTALAACARTGVRRVCVWCLPARGWRTKLTLSSCKSYACFKQRYRTVLRHASDHLRTLDLRQKVIAAVGRGDSTIEEVAASFGVGQTFVVLISFVESLFGVAA